MRRSATQNSEEIRRTVEEGKRQMARLAQGARLLPDTAATTATNAT
jgi:hypothetical protein